MTVEDFESVRYAFVHPDQGATTARSRLAAVICMAVLLGAASALGFAGTTWLQSLPEPVKPLSCGTALNECEAALPANLKDLPTQLEVKAAARSRILTVMLGMAAELGEPDVGWELALEGAEPGLAPRSQEDFLGLISEGFTLEVPPMPEVPHEAWGTRVAQQADTWARQEAEHYGRANALLRDMAFHDLEVERAQQALAYQQARVRRFAGIGGVVGVLLAAVLGLIALLLGRRARTLAPIEVELGRHRLLVDGVPIHLSALSEADVHGVIAALGADGHFCVDSEELRRGLSERVAAQQRGETDPEARRVLQRLLQRG